MPETTRRGIGAKIRTLAASAATIATLAAMAGCGSQSDITSGRLSSALGPNFARLYAVQQRQLGRITVVSDQRASCSRGGPAEADRGPGTDWVCTVNYPYPDGHIEPLAYDVTVSAIGCYTADGPPAVVGQQHVSLPDGKSVTNPLFAFDGCFQLG